MNVTIIALQTKTRPTGISSACRSVEKMRNSLELEEALRERKAPSRPPAAAMVLWKRGDVRGFGPPNRLASEKQINADVRSGMDLINGKLRK